MRLWENQAWRDEEETRIEAMLAAFQRSNGMEATRREVGRLCRTGKELRIGADAAPVLLDEMEANAFSGGQQPERTHARVGLMSGIARKILMGELGESHWIGILTKNQPNDGEGEHESADQRN